MANVKLSDEVRAVLEASTITENSVHLPPNLERGLYEAVNKALTAAGGKWNRNAQAHLFQGDPRVKLGLALENGFVEDEKKKFQAFYTPPELAARVVELAEVSGQRVLEPSAGQGALVKECVAQGAGEINCVELNEDTRQTLIDLSAAHPGRVHLEFGDFMNWVPDHGFYDRIVMNPPFTRDQDVIHVERALSFLKPGGILVAIMLDNMGRKRFQCLTGFLDELGTEAMLASRIPNAQPIYWFHKVPRGAFKDTDVQTIILKIKLPKVATAEPPAPQSPAPVAVPAAHREPTTALPLAAPAAAPVPSTTATDDADADQPEIVAPKLMKLTIDRQQLAAVLAAVKSSAATKTDSILSNLLVQAEQPASFTVTASDGDRYLVCEAEGNVEEGGAVCVRAALLYELCRQLGSTSMDDSVEIELKETALHVKCGDTESIIATVEPTDFPPVPPVEEPVAFGLDQSALHSLLARTAFATSDDEKRLVLNGTFIEFTKAKLNVAACDGRRLGLVTVEAPPITAPADFSSGYLIVPAKTVTDLLRLLNPHDESSVVNVIVGKSTVSFEFGALRLVSKVIEGQYVDFRKIIPKDGGKIADLRREDLLAAVTRIALFADAVKLSFTNDPGTRGLSLQSVRLAGDKKEAMGEIKDAVVTSTSASTSLVLGTRYLLDTLKAAPGEFVEFYAEQHIALFKVPAEHWLSVVAGLPPKK